MVGISGKRTGTVADYGSLMLSMPSELTNVVPEVIA
jgi:hypothetical protein